MAWDRSQPPNPKYRTPEHRAERTRWVGILKRQGSVLCAQPVCVMSTRVIFDGDPWHLGHTDDGAGYLGPVHPACNVKDGARRGNQRARGVEPPTRWAL